MSSETETDVSEALDAITECPVCCKLMKEATSLPCLHTFCLKCLGTRITNSTVTCPTCEKTHPAKDIRRDHFIQDIIDEGLSSSTSGGSGKTICDFCVEDDLESRTGSNGTGFEAQPGTLATLHCLDCRRNLCVDCARGHRRHCQSHVVVDLDDVLVRRRSIARSVARCSEHPDESLKIFCTDCRMVVCVLCYAENHNTHQCKDVAKAASEFQRQLREIGTWMDVCKTGMSSALSDLEKEWRLFEDSLRDTRSKIREKGEHMKRIIDGHMMRLTQELQSLNQGKWNEFEAEKKAFNVLLSDVDHLTQYSLVLTENGSPYHIADSFHRLQAKATELKVTRPGMNGMAGQRVQMIFANPDPLERIKGETEEVLGRVSLSQVSHTVEESELESSASEVSSISKSLSAFEVSSKSVRSVNGEEAPTKLLGTVESDGRGVMGVTILNNKLYFVCAWTNNIFVHQAEPPFSRNEAILVKDMKCPNDMVSCPESDCIYITDSEHGCVWRISDAGQSDRWVGKAGQPWTISVRRGRVLLPSDGKPPQLNIYGPGGGILSRIRLPTAIESVQHAIELRNGNFIVSHGRNSGRSSRICEISKTGHIVRGFDGMEPKGGPSRSALVKWPKHLAIGENEETILVAEFSNHYVLRLSRYLQLDKILLSWDDDRIDAPTRLCWVPGTGRVLLAEPACVKIYEVSDLRSKSSAGTPTKRLDLFDAPKK